MLQRNIGLASHDLALFRSRTNIILHSASSITLLSPLEKLVGPVVDATERLANIALECDPLESFIYVSSAYANAHLFAQTDRTSGVEVQESLYPLHGSGSGHSTDEYLEKEWREVQKTGFSAAFRSHDFPWAYAYAKHLAERLLSRAFTSSSKRLLILRPSIIEPAQCFPYRNFCHPMSNPPSYCHSCGCPSAVTDRLSLIPL
jgi:thioester reductase-like protein